MSICADILWEENTRGPDPIKGSHEGVIVFSSKPGQNAPADQGCQTRTEMPQVGQLERCILFKHQSKNAYIAYPAVDNYTCIQMPGDTNHPIMLRWDANEQNTSEVIASVILRDSYYRVFANSAWPGKVPVPGTSILCNVRWMRHFPSNSIIGYAMPAKQADTDNIEVTVANNAVWIGDTGVMLVTTTTGYQVTAKSGQDAKIIIELMPDN